MLFFSDELPPLREERAPSPPPAYDEVTKSQKPTEQTDGISTSDVKIDMGNESPPEYAAAIAMSATQNATQVNKTHQIVSPISNSNLRIFQTTVKLGNTELFGRPKIVP